MVLKIPSSRSYFLFQRRLSVFLRLRKITFEKQNYNTFPRAGFPQGDYEAGQLRRFTRVVSFFCKSCHIFLQTPILGVCCSIPSSTNYLTLKPRTNKILCKLEELYSYELKYHAVLPWGCFFNHGPCYSGLVKCNCGYLLISILKELAVKSFEQARGKSAKFYLPEGKQNIRMPLAGS